jgi:hypothetical protein
MSLCSPHFILATGGQPTTPNNYQQLPKSENYFNSFHYMGIHVVSCLACSLRTSKLRDAQTGGQGGTF